MRCQGTVKTSLATMDETGNWSLVGENSSNLSTNTVRLICPVNGAGLSGSVTSAARVGVALRFPANLVSITTLHGETIWFHIYNMKMNTASTVITIPQRA